MATIKLPEDVFREKRKPKNPIKFNITLNEEQKEAKRIILNSTISLIKGHAGSGKSLLAAQIALDLLFTREVEKIIITRALVVSGNEQVGILPGDIKDKLAPFTAPVYDNMYRLYEKVKIDNIIEEGKIEVIPFAFMRGRNLTNSIVIVDEAQNATDHQMEMIITRLCQGSKMIICGDTGQIDLRNKKESGLFFLNKIADQVPGVSVINLKTNHRHEIVEPILKVYEQIRD